MKDVNTASEELRAFKILKSVFVHMWVFTSSEMFVLYMFVFRKVLAFYISNHLNCSEH